MLKIVDDNNCLFRYEEYQVGMQDEYGNTLHSYTKLNLLRYEIIKHTKKGAWIKYFANKSGKKFINFDWKKRFACRTKKEALESFKFRKKRQIRIIKSRLRIAESALKICERKLESEDYDLKNIGGGLF